MRKKILIVDDMELNREILSEILNDEYDILEADDGDVAIRMLHEKADEIAAILLDLIMPRMDGFSVLEEMRTLKLSDKIPVIIISGEDSVKVEKRCFNYGISDFIRKPFDNVLVKKRTKNVTELFSYKNSLEEKVKQQTETLTKQYKLLHTQAEKLKKTNTQIIDILATIVESRNLESGEHVLRVKEYTRILANILMKEYPEYGLTPQKVQMIAEASALHDVGKISIPDNILLKPGRLTAEEFECMKTHTTRGSEILMDIKDIWSEDYAKLSYDICRYHHEKYDGRGYPDHLAGEDIPIAAQLVSVADVYDALVNERCYKDAYTPEQAYQMITGGECGAFSPKIMECFRQGREQFEKLAVKREEKTMQKLKPIKEGKVREIYDNGDSLIMVATDRISCFDVILHNTVTKKGTVLTQMSRFWFDMTQDIIPNHMISVDVNDMPEFFRQPAYDGNSMMCRKLNMLPIECIVRGYITGSGWESYKKDGTVCGIRLPEGLKESDKLPEPIYTPSTKAEIGDHDENISYEASVEYLEKRFPGKGEEYASKLRDYTLALYKKCADYALTRGIIIADTKFEFGLDEKGNMVLGDEMLTPDSSRFWPAEGYEPGHAQPSFDKQFARDWLKANKHDWTLPDEIVQKTINKYLQGYELLTGKPLEA